MALNWKLANSASVKVSCNIRTQFCHVSSARHAPGTPATLIVTILKCTSCLGWMLGPGCGSIPSSINLPNLASESSLSLFCSLFLIAGPAFLVKNSVAVATVVCHFSESNSFVFSGKSKKLFGHL